MIKNGILDWDCYFMAMAHLTGKRSKDPNTQVGAVIVDEHKHVVGMGYNGLPNGCADDVYPWAREGSFIDTKYAYVVHAELNAILNSTANLHGCTIYVSLFPCNECAKAIIQSGITRIVYECDKYAETEGVQASKRMLTSAGVEFVPLGYEVKISVEETNNTK